MYQTTTNYFDLVQETATIIVDEISAANTRTLNYVKSLWEIAARSNGESALRSAYERAEAVVSLTASEIETSLRSSLEVTEKLLAQGKKLKTQSYESAREITDKALVNAKQVVEAASDRIESLTDSASESIDHTISEVNKKKSKATAAAE